MTQTSYALLEDRVEATSTMRALVFRGPNQPQTFIQGHTS
jgi:hypothetical protein